MSFYANAASVAKKQTESKGRNVTLRRNTEGTYDPAADTISGASTADETIKAVITEYEQGEIEETIIVRGDKKVLIAATSLSSPPDHNDIIVDGSQQYRIVHIQAVQPGDTLLLYKLHVRK